jgi:protein-disulfide isomerase
MRNRLLAIVIVATLLVLPTGALVRAQSPEVEALKKEVDALRSEIDEIKTLLRERVGVPMRGVVLGTGDGPFKGAPDARVTVVEFSDYQCPFCGRHARETLPKIDETYIKTGKVKYVFRDFPLERIHPNAVKAAEAARCAGESGKYWEMHNRLFGDQKAGARLQFHHDTGRQPDRHFGIRFVDCIRTAARRSARSGMGSIGTALVMRAPAS